MLRAALITPPCMPSPPPPPQKAEAFGKQVWLVDARNKVLGRVSADIARVLTGKHKPLYDPSLMTGDTVVVVNCKDVAVTGKKREQKLYRKHSGWTGNLRTVVYKDLVAKKPNEALRLAVKGMLPRNKLRDRLLKQRLLLYEVRSRATHTDIIRSPIPASLMWPGQRHTCSRFVDQR